jgi:hypothetical protein
MPHGWESRAWMWCARPRSARAFGRDRRVCSRLYSPASQLSGQVPEGMAAPHSIFQRAERMGEWKALRSSIGCDEIAAAFGAAHFARELIAKLPPEVRQKMQEAQRARDALSDLQARREALARSARAMAAPTLQPKPPSQESSGPDELGRQMGSGGRRGSASGVGFGPRNRRLSSLWKRLLPAPSRRWHRAWRPRPKA